MIEFFENWLIAVGFVVAVVAGLALLCSVPAAIVLRKPPNALWISVVMGWIVFWLVTLAAVMKTLEH